MLRVEKPNRNRFDVYTSYLRLEGHVLHDKFIIDLIDFNKNMLNFFNWEFIFSIGKKPFNLALGIGPNIGPVRALEKGLSLDIFSDILS